MITKCVLTAILHPVVRSWIKSSKESIKYEIDKINHQDWLNKGPWYNTAICSSSYRSMFENFITHAITNRYNLMCYLVAHDKKNQLMKINTAVFEIV